MSAGRILSVAALTLFLAVPSANADLLFNLNETRSFTHETGSNNFGDTNPPTGGSEALTNGTFSWGGLATDGSLNSSNFAGTSFSASDWGGQGTYTSNVINVSTYDTADFTVTGSSSFNNPPSEFFNFFYQLDGGAIVAFSSSITGLDVSGATNLVIGFDFSHNGGSDNVNVSQLQVDAFSVVPEPASAGLLGLAAIAGIGFIRRRKK